MHCRNVLNFQTHGVMNRNSMDIATLYSVIRELIEYLGLETYKEGAILCLSWEALGKHI